MYCETQDIEAYFQNKDFKFETFLTVDKVRSFIVNETMFINLIIKRKHSLPITNPDDLIVLKMICEKLVVGTIDDIIREKNVDGDYVRSRNLRKEALDFLDKIAIGEMTLNMSGKSSVIKFNNTDSNGNEVEKEFKVGNIEPTNDIFDRETHTIIRTS
jgi:hypothetical protein